nr:RNA-directed DNA polymerase, eukaryota, reverse transcriptase zinc-binding domain protein [Tanacetum cinerariifolium]
NVYENESDGAYEFNENPLAKNRDKHLEKQAVVSDAEDETWVPREKPMGEYKSDIGKMKETTMKIGECGGSGVGAGADMEIDDPPSDKKTMRPRRNLEKKEERPRFSLTLSHKEIEDDLFAMTGKKPPHRQKKRSRTVRAQINEIKDALWDCGGGKASGPDEFTFKFIKHYWGSIGTHFIEMVKRFETDGFIPRVCNSSLIALVPKKQDPLYINDYRPISLIGCQYKVIAKVVANRLQKVVQSVVSEVQMAYIKGRQIIDGSLMVNEIISWASKKNERLFLFKVDVEKALILLKSVLGALVTYFFSLFLALKCVINYLEKLRRNFSWGGTLDCNKMAWVEKKFAPHIGGGLGIGGYGSIPTSSAPLSAWKTIISFDNQLSCVNISLESIFIRQVGDGSLFRFGLDYWIGATILKTMFPRLFFLELHKQCTICDIFSSNNGSQQFNFNWRRPIRNGPEATQLNGLLGLLSDFVIVGTPDEWACFFISSKTYTVALIRKQLEHSLLSSNGEAIRWNRDLPIKINIHSWRISLD